MRFSLVLFTVLVMLLGAAVANWSPKPYRVLVVVGTWGDPASMLISSDKDAFQPGVALLKAWSVPFDILRLDQQLLTAGYLFKRSGRVRYGAVLWLVDSDPYTGKHLEILEQVVHGGTNLLVVRSRFHDPVLEELLAARLKEQYSDWSSPLQIKRSHFITRELRSSTVQGNRALSMEMSGDVAQWVEARGAEVLIDQAGWPLLTVNQLQPGVAAIWMGPPSLTALEDSALWRELYFRSLVQSLGYLVSPDIDYWRRIVLNFDDLGASDKSSLSYWHYKMPNEESIRQHLIAPLKKRNALMVANVVSGFVDRKTQRIPNPWFQ